MHIQKSYQAGLVFPTVGYEQNICNEYSCLLGTILFIPSTSMERRRTQIARHQVMKGYGHEQKLSTFSCVFLDFTSHADHIGYRAYNR